MAEWKHVINEWLAEYAALQPDEIKSFAAEHEHNHEIATAVFNMFSDLDVTNSQSTSEDYEKVLENVCNQFLCFYRSKEPELQRFTLQFVPTIMFNYLSLDVQQENKNICRCLETLLISVHNIEVMDDSGKPKVISFRLPSLAQSSIYHEPLSLGPQFLTESALRRWEDCNTKLVTWGPQPQVEVLNAENRMQVMTSLLFIYNKNVAMMQKFSLRHFCEAASSIVTQGFKTSKTTSTAFSTLPRIAVSSGLMLELAEGARLALGRECAAAARRALRDAQRRARYELLPDAMLVTAAVLDSLTSNALGEPADGALGLGAALAPAAAAVSKTMITNASFRTKKLPDDIPIQPGEEAGELGAITEEGEAEPAPLQRGAARASKPKLPSFPGLGKKSKEPKDKAAEKKVTLKDSSKAIWSTLSGGGDATEREGSGEPNGSGKDEASTGDNSDSRSQLTTDSLEMEPMSRFAALQVSSV